jgi:hypothetical protein
MSSTVTPIMAGGTGRSGTTVIAGLLHRHSLVRASWPREVKFVNKDNGLLDLVLGPAGRRRLGRRPSSLSARLAAFEAGMRGAWWLRTNRLGRASGLHLSMEESERERLLAELAAQVGVDPLAAGREFLTGMIRAQRGDAGEPWWIDTSPPNIANAQRIRAFWPEARFIWMVRDGRSTAASVMAERWGPDDPFEAITWWEQRMRRAHEGMAGVPSQTALVLSLEDLVVLDREASYGRVLDFLGLDDDPTMRAFFDEQMPAERVGLDKWRTRVPDPVAFESAYRTAEAALLADGIEVFARPGA